MRDLDGVEEFYRAVVGLETVSRTGSVAELGVAGRTVVGLVGDPEAAAPPRRSTGLYHLAILVPSRAELARSLRRLIEARWRLVGAADHLVSEALYLEDPEGNGIEIYRDRPREAWRRDGDEIAMATLPLDLQDLLTELGRPDAAHGPEGIPAGTRMGHVHLHVSSLAEAERFYGQLLGFDVSARGYPGALFMSAGGYHHHLGLNIWMGEGAPPPPSGSSGLHAFEVLLPDQAQLDAIEGRLSRAGVTFERQDGAVGSLDPAGNRVVLRCPEG